MRADHSPISRPAAGGIGRLAIALALAAAGVLTPTLWSGRYREMEAWLAAHSTALVTPATSFGDRWLVEGRPTRSVVLVVTSSCSTGILVMPLLLAGALALMVRRIQPLPALIGLAAGLLLLICAGTVRLTMISLAWHEWGSQSKWLSHDLLGTLITLLSGAAALGVMLVIGSRRDRTSPRAFGHALPRDPGARP